LIVILFPSFILGNLYSNQAPLCPSKRLGQAQNRNINFGLGTWYLLEEIYPSAGKCAAVASALRDENRWSPGGGAGQKRYWFCCGNFDPAPPHRPRPAPPNFFGLIVLDWFYYFWRNCVSSWRFALRRQQPVSMRRLGVRAMVGGEGGGGMVILLRLKEESGMLLLSCDLCYPPPKTKCCCCTRSRRTSVLMWVGVGSDQINRNTTMVTDMRPLLFWALWLLNNFSNFCPLTTFDTS
jgi:hypothetical protein